MFCLAEARAANPCYQARSALVLAFASDAVLVRFNCLAYGSDETPASPAFRMRSFPWEEEVVATFSHLGLQAVDWESWWGREVLALAQMGCEVMSSEPSAALTWQWLARTAEDSARRPIPVYYEYTPAGKPLPLAPSAPNVAPSASTLDCRRDFSELRFSS